MNIANDSGLSRRSGIGSLRGRVGRGVPAIRDFEVTDHDCV